MQTIDDDQGTEKPATQPKVLVALSRNFLHSAAQRFARLNFSQWCYLLAFALLLIVVDDNYIQDSNILWVGIPAAIGLAREFWMLFSRLWQHLLGKGVVLVLYAATANFAVAVSAMKINEVVGIEPSIFVFTLGFTTLLMLPFWLLVATVLFFSLALVAVNLWLLISILLRVVRVKIQVHWEDKSFVFITMFLRLILIPAVIMTLVKFIEPYTQQMAYFDNAIQIYEPGDFSEEELEQIRNAADGETAAVIEAIRNSRTESGAEPVDESAGSKRYLDILVATFIYWFETYPRSQCHKTPEQRSLIIDENSVLLAERDKSELGYKFTVHKCVPRYPTE